MDRQELASAGAHHAAWRRATHTKVSRLVSLRTIGGVDRGRDVGDEVWPTSALGSAPCDHNSNLLGRWGEKDKVMKVVNDVRYIASPEKVIKVRPAHRAYMAELYDQGRLFAGGPYVDGTGALFIYEAESLDEAEAIFAADPFNTQGAVASYELKPWDLVLAHAAPGETAK